jgi:iduronate 2-sulfatase
MLVCLLLLSSMMSYAQKNKNILFIAVDDLKPLLSNYGHKEMKTPNFDRLAKMGVTFTNAHVQQAVCGPSRASVMTGTTPDMTRVWDLETDFRKSNPNLISMPQHLVDNGYESAAVGKIFHKTSSSPGHDGKSWTIEHIAPEGADLGSGIPIFTYYQDPATKKEAARIEEELRAKGNNKANLRNEVFKKIKPSTESTVIADEGYQDGVYTQEALTRMKSMAKGNKPFFLAVGYQRPHLPFVAPKKYWDLYKRSSINVSALQKKGIDIPQIAFHNSGELRAYTDIPTDFDLDKPLPIEKQKELIHGYMACISYIDAQLGKLLDEYYKLGLDKTTNIVLWGDHGFHLGDHNTWCKHGNFEQATRIPLMFAGPGVEKNIKVNAPVELVDVFPTLFDLASVPQHPQTEGKSLITLMDKDTKKGIAPKYAVSQFSRLKTVKGYSLRTDRYRYTEWHGNNYNSFKPYDEKNIQGKELYDYVKDPLESKNLIGTAEYKKIEEELKSMLKGHLASKLDKAKNNPYLKDSKGNAGNAKADVDDNDDDLDGDEDEDTKMTPEERKAERLKKQQEKKEERLKKKGGKGEDDKSSTTGVDQTKKKSDTATSGTTTSTGSNTGNSTTTAPPKSTTTSAKSNKPNVVFIIGDDLGYHDLSHNGAVLNNTPNIDKLAKEGRIFNQAYSSYPRCTPSRYGLITGTYPVNEDHGNLAGIPTESNFIRQFKAAGYQSSYVGKWHLGGGGSAPKGFGFDHSFAAGTAGGADTHFYPFNKEKSKDDPEKYIEDVTKAGKEGDFLADLLTDQTINYIKSSDRSKPFFAMLAHYSVHTPLEAKAKDIAVNDQQVKGINFGTQPEYIKEGEGRNKMRQDNTTYAAMVENFDYNIGRIMQTLKDLGIDDNTIIVITSDHGGLSNGGNKGERILATTNYPLRAGKGHLYEGGVRVPLIMNWKNKLTPGVDNKNIVLGMDVMPTLLDLTIDGSIKNVDGKSFEKVFDNKEDWSTRTVFWHEKKARPYSTGDIPCTSVRSGNYKLMHFFQKDIYELYNLQNDKEEKNNLYTKEPAKAKELKALLDQWKANYLVDAKINRKAPGDTTGDGEDGNEGKAKLSKEERQAKKEKKTKE